METSKGERQPERVRGRVRNGFSLLTARWDADA